MASTSPPNQDTLVSIKINIEGNNRRFKLPLRDLGASTLPEKLRFLLSIPPSAEVLFERYSDSAATFVVLDSNNASVYKQLYRAAKAKLKLRLRVTVTLKEPAVPKPATVEDEESSPVSPVEPVAAISPTPDESTTTIACEASSSVTYTERVAKPVSVAEIQRGFEDLLISNQGSRSVHSARVSAPKPVDFSGCCSHSSSSIPSMFHHKEVPRLNNCSSTEIPVSRGTAARDKWFSELATLSAERHSLRSETTAPSSAPVSMFSVFCNNCHDAIPDAHYHCGTCEAGDFDLCQNCVDKGVVCDSEDHWMIKRYVKNGNVITSTTETMAPKKKTPVEPDLVAEFPTQDSGLQIATRTCNSCIQGKLHYLQSFIFIANLCT